MTPGWLHKHCVITENYTLHPQYLELDQTTVINKPPGFQQAIQVKLVASDIFKRHQWCCCNGDYCHGN